MTLETIYKGRIIKCRRNLPLIDSATGHMLFNIWMNLIKGIEERKKEIDNESKI